MVTVYLLTWSILYSSTQYIYIYIYIRWKKKTHTFLSYSASLNQSCCFTTTLPLLFNLPLYLLSLLSLSTLLLSHHQQLLSLLSPSPLLFPSNTYHHLISMDMDMDMPISTSALNPRLVDNLFIVCIQFDGMYVLCLWRCLSQYASRALLGYLCKKIFQLILFSNWPGCWFWRNLFEFGDNILPN